MMSRRRYGPGRGKPASQPGIADALHSDVGDPADLPAVRSSEHQDDLEDTLREIGQPLRPRVGT